MNHSYSIRLMNSEDLDELAIVYLKAFQDPELGEDWSKQSALELISYWLQRQPDLAFVAEQEEKLVGAFIVGVRPWWDGNHLVDGELFVDPEYQKKGIGKELINKVLLVAKEKYAPLTWETYTFRAQEFPLSWYKQMGFEEIEEWVMIRANTESVLVALRK
jgi:GNAT superfamily N-acetyltransferase